MSQDPETSLEGDGGGTSARHREPQRHDPRARSGWGRRMRQELAQGSSALAVQGREARARYLTREDGSHDGSGSMLGA